MTTGVVTNTMQQLTKQRRQWQLSKCNNQQSNKAARGSKNATINMTDNDGGGYQQSTKCNNQDNDSSDGNMQQ